MNIYVIIQVIKYNKFDVILVLFKPSSIFKILPQGQDDE